MKQRKNILEGYNKTAQQYRNELLYELDGKSLDRILLKRFAEDNIRKGAILDLGCGPGQTTFFLAGCGIKSLVGIDLSSGMIEVASEFPVNGVDFREGDMLDLEFADNQFGSAICFYGIVHFTYDELAIALAEIRRVIKPEGQFLFSFHIGTEIKKTEELFGEKVNMEFYFFEVEKVLEILAKTGWKQVEVVERYPYEGAEYPSRRAYILVEK